MKRIDTTHQYERALIKWIEFYLDHQPPKRRVTPAQIIRLIELCEAVAAYERKHYPLKPLTPRQRAKLRADIARAKQP